MTVNQSAAQVASHPAKPLMIYDGHCNFCKFWIIRWQQATAGRVDYAASQEPRVREQFPEIPRERFEESVQFIETDGRVYSGAEAVFRSLTYRSIRRPGRFGSIATFPDSRRSRNGPTTLSPDTARGFPCSRGCFGGARARCPTYALVRWVFLRLLGIIYLIAFVSLGTQIAGLAGSRGISPAANYVEAARAHFDQAGVGAATLLFVADALLVQRRRQVSSFSVRRRGRAGVAGHLRHRPGAVPVSVVAGLSVALNGLRRVS